MGGAAVALVIGLAKAYLEHATLAGKSSQPKGQFTPPWSAEKSDPPQWTYHPPPKE